VDKKPLIGVSICAVVLLVLGSLTNVVGYQSVKSTTVSDSPLFKTRTQRATNQQQNSIISKYLGKGKTSNLLILPRNETITLHEIISNIQAMDESTFNRFVDYAINQINHNNNYKDIDVKTLINELRQIRNIKENDINFKDTNNERRTILFHYVPSACFFPGCYLFAIIFLSFLFIIYFSGLPSIKDCMPN